MVELKETEPFMYQMEIIERHLDTFGHVNNATYLEILEEARWAFVSQRGFGLDVIQEKKVGPTILEWRLRFLKEIRLRETITIHSNMLGYEGKIAKMEQSIRNQADEICCKAEMTFGLFDMKTRKLIMPTPEWLYALGYEAIE